MSSNLSDSEVICNKNPSYVVSKDIQTSDTNIFPNYESSDEECALLSRIKKPLQRFTDSESDSDQDVQKKNEQSESEAKTTNRILSTSEQSDSKDESDSDNNEKSFKNEQQQLRIKNKRNKLREKFKSLVTSRSKENSKMLTDSEKENQSSSDESLDEDLAANNVELGINKIIPFKSSICDPDTSDEENMDDKKDSQISKSPHQRKSTKLVSPKPLRMSVKEAMENRQKIRSESNRLLREKEISLPYHRPKAFSLKDIMNRRKPAMSADGKALPIKMNEEQLKQYAQMLEQRQKEIMDLCKSDSEEEEDNFDAANIQKAPFDNSNNNNTSTPLDSSEYNEPNKEAVELTSVKEIPLEEETEINNALDHICEKRHTELNNSSNMEVDQFSLEDNLITLDSHLTKESMAIDIIDKVNMVTKNDISEDNICQHLDVTDKSVNGRIANNLSEPESQFIHLQYDSVNTVNDKPLIIEGSKCDTPKQDLFEVFENDPSDDIDMDYIDKLIENAETDKGRTIEDNGKSSTLSTTLNVKPKLTGVPGMVIDLNNTQSGISKKISGVELLKERFSYFAKLKTPEELEREKEKKLKPGAQHLRLKQQLEEIIAEQRSLEWSKRLNEEKQQQIELKGLRGEESDAEEDIEKIEALIEESDIECEESSEEYQSEPEENDLGEIKEKPRKKNCMIDDEAEETDCDEEDIEEDKTGINRNDNLENDKDNECKDSSYREISSVESSDNESEYEETTKTKKGRILKAFEDSDDEAPNEVLENIDGKERSAAEINNESHSCVQDKIDGNETKEITNNTGMEFELDVGSQIHKQSQDEEIQLAQRMESASDDLFDSQENTSAMTQRNSQGDDDENALATQTFSILKSNNYNKDVMSGLENSQNFSFTSDTQKNDNQVAAAVALCSGSFTQNLISSNLALTQQPIDQSQAIGEDVLALCTGKFYDNQFISQSEEKENGIHENVNDTFDDSWSKADSQEDETGIIIDNRNNITDKEQKESENIIDKAELKDNNLLEEKYKQKAEDQNLLQSIIAELNAEDKIDSFKANKYFETKNISSDVNDKYKKKFVIESDDELSLEITEQKEKKKVKKKKLEQRALQISDDEEDDFGDEEDFDLEQGNDEERIVEYDSEENEIEVKQMEPRKKRKVVDFFENEAELTSEDEWVGSGDEDEAGLDRMEREEGDDETFHQGKLQRELGQIHMRDVLDQDKREVRLIQELLFEDGDLGDGHRQRKFRWRNADGEEEPGSIVDDFADTPEEEFESEEQWRKQRHEREIFLKQMKEQDKNEDTPNVTLSRSAIIKANLSSKPMSSLLLEVNDTSIKKTDKIENSMIKEKTIKDIPCPRNGFTILQQNYHSSLLTRGRGALARLAALATPLAVDEDSTKVATVAPKNQRNFVFAAITKEDDEPKVTKRKADSKLDTPRLVKKLKTNEKKTLTRNSLLDHLKI